MGKNYLVTGGTDGIGRAIVEKILQESSSENDKIIIIYGHSDAKAQALIDSLSEADSKKIELIKFDMSDATKLDELVLEIEKREKKLDYFISNVGIGEYAKFEDYTVEMWNRVITTNLTVPIFLIQKLRDKIRENGSVLLVGSYAGINAYSSSVVYSVSKAGLLFAAKTLVKELEQYKVRINAIAPGFIETRWQEGRSEESRERINKKIALHRFGSAEEVADMAYNIVRNSYINGSIVEIHGGYEYF